jgi:glycerol-3-phosphate dehydrogenase (NAD(P)+)
MSMEYAHIGVVGSGAWGTALAVLANRAGTRVTLYTRNDNVRETILQTRVNSVYLPDHIIDPAIEVTDEWGLLKPCDALIISIPAQALRTAMISLSDSIASTMPLVLATKGIERGSLMLASEVVQSILPHNPLLVLSGPNFAGEAAAGLPTASVLASYHTDIAKQMAFMLGGKYFRLYISDDIAGVQIGGALKNVLAIAAGITQGLRLGENARAALITRGLAEMARLAVAKGGREETLMGLAGMGDALLSCSSQKSRNFALGQSLGMGVPLHQLLGGRNPLTEGVATAESVYQLSRKLGVQMPIMHTVYQILSEEVPLAAAIESLLSRPAMQE